MEKTKKDSNDTGVDPFTQCITLPSACHFVFRRNFMESQSIGLIPPNGYSGEPSSHKAIIWLRYVSVTKNINLSHSRNGNEKRILDYKIKQYTNSMVVYLMVVLLVTDLNHLMF